MHISRPVFLENNAQSHFFHDWCWHHACSHAHDVVLKQERSFGTEIKPHTYRYFGSTMLQNIKRIN